MPDWKQIIREHLAVLRLPPEREIEIVEELALHLEAVYEDALAAGLSAAEAEARAAQGYDWRLLECELSRAEQTPGARALQPSLELIERKGGIRMESLLQDLRFGARMLMKQPGFTLIAVLTLALGIGANTAIFSLVNGILLRPLPFEDPERLVFISERTQRVPVMAASLPNFIDWREQNRVFERMAAFRDQTYNLTGVEEPERLLGRMVTGDYFSALGVEPILGRAFTPEEDKPGGARAVVLSYGFWQRRFGGDPNIVGRALTLDNDLYTVIGVMPKEFSVPAQPSELWTSLGAVSNRLMFRGFHFGTFVYARRKPDVTLEQARADMDTIAKRLQGQYPQSNKGSDIRVEDLTS